MNSMVHHLTSKMNTYAYSSFDTAAKNFNAQPDNQENVSVSDGVHLTALYSPTTKVELSY